MAQTKENITYNKTLYIARHAKSSWNDSSLSDFERPLKKRGEKDAPMIGEVLFGKSVQLDLIISSPAKRAITTAHILAKALNYPAETITTYEAVYHASVSELLDIIMQLDDSLNNVMIVGHNPSFTNLTNYLTKEYFDNVPTCGVVAVSFSIPWRSIDKNSGKMLFFEYPKKYKKKN